MKVNLDKNEANAISLLCSYYLLNVNGKGMDLKSLEVLFDENTQRLIANSHERIHNTINANRDDRQN